jgi:uncharacterized protein YidB (DUF937 family)
MSWNDLLQQSLGSLMGQGSPLPALVKNALTGQGLQAVLAQLQQAGLGEHVSSWLDQNRSNIPVSADQLRAALGNEQVQKLAASLGLPVDQILAALTQHLPQAASESARDTEDNDKT